MTEGDRAKAHLGDEPKVKPMLSAELGIRLDRFRPADFCRGRSGLVEAFWLVLQALVLTSFIPGSVQRRVVLRLFGAKIGKGVVIKPGVRVKFPWRLSICDHSWIGEDVWIDNLAPVKIGRHCCLSQATYLCTGSHDWSQPHFDLVTRPIELADGVWIAARATIGPGVTAGEGSVLGLSSTATNDLEPWSINFGVPAVRVRRRELRIEPNASPLAGTSAGPSRQKDCGPASQD